MNYEGQDNVRTKRVRPVDPLPPLVNENWNLPPHDLIHHSCHSLIGNTTPETRTKIYPQSQDLDENLTLCTFVSSNKIITSSITR